MKKIIQESFRQFITSRYLVTTSLGLLLLALIFALYIGLNVKPSELQLVTHYSAYGITHLYRDQWFYLLTFGLFGLFVAVSHILIAAKVFVMKGQSLAAMVLWLGISIILFAWVMAGTIINVWSPS